MMTLTQIANRIKKARRDKIPDYKIGREMGVCAAEVKRLASGKYPGPKVARRLGLVEKCPSCHRRIVQPREKIVIPHIGHLGWLEEWLKPIHAQKNRPPSA